MSRTVFRSYAGIDQLQIADAEDLARIEELDRARWAATSAPVDQLFCDPVFLGYVDGDGNGRVRRDEVREARRWLWARLRDRSRLAEETDELMLDAIDPGAEGAPLRALAERLLGELAAPQRDRIRLEQVRRFRAEYSSRFPNGDGVVTGKQLPEAPLADLAAAVVATTGGTPDLSGEAGVSAANLDAWQDRVRSFVAWEARREAVRPLGDDTAAAADLVAALAPKVAQFFAQCALVSLEANAATRLQASPEELAKLDVTNPGAIDAWLATAPLARPDASGLLDLDGPLNPRFAPELRRLARDVAPRALGLDAPLTTLDPERWAALQAVFAPFLAWRAERPEGIAADATPEALAALADGPLPERLRGLCAEDLRVGAELVAFNDLEKLVLLHRWLLELANNFVSFPALFIPTERTLFEMGTLVLDGRKLSLCVRVTDRAAHKKIAATSLMFVAYVELVRKDGDKEVKDQIAAAVTAGMRGGISVGKRGVFYDRDEREWDAIVVDLIENPISVWEAAVAPFLRVRDAVASRMSGMLGSKAAELEKEAASATDAQVTAATTTAAQATAPAPGGAPPGGGSAAPPANGNNLQNLLVGGGVALAAIGSSMAFIVQTVAGVDLVQALFGMLLLALGVAAVFGLLGWLKLRRRDVSALLEACGWALNGRMRLTHHLSLLFTQRPGLPPGAVRKRQLPRNLRPWLVGALVLAALAVLAWAYAEPGRLGPLEPLLRRDAAAADAPAADPAAAPADAPAAAAPAAAP